MVYLVGIIGFIGGFFAGQMLLLVILRHKSKKELLEDDSIKWLYGTLNWILAGLGAYIFVQYYNEYQALSAGL